jgi:hypothetical protein
MNGSEQLSLFNPNRYSPVSVAVMHQLPEGSARSFMIASALGQFLRLDGSSKRLRSGKDAGGTLITKRHRKFVLQSLEIDESRWRKLVKDWEKRYVAHRCSRGVVFLFAKWLEDECPACHAEILHDSLPPGPHRARGDGFADGHPHYASGTTRPVSEAISGTTRPGTAVLPDPLSERERGTQKELSNEGDRKGVGP